MAGPRAALAELAHLEPDPARVGPVDIDGLSFRGAFRLLAGDLGQAIGDLTASLRLARRGATLTLGLRAYFYLAMAQYLAGAWDDVLLTAEQGFSAAAIHSRRFELPLLHLAAACVPAGRGAAEEAERHAVLAEEAAASLDYGQERVYAAMARALVCQAAGDYLGMADALGPGRTTPALDGRSRVYAVLWRPLLAEGLVGSGQLERAAAVLAQLRADSGQVSYLAPALAWLDGWLAEQRGDAGRGAGELRARRGQRRRPAARCTPPGCCWPTAGCCGAPASGARPSSGCGGPASCTTALRAAPFIARGRGGTGGLPPAGRPGQEAVGAGPDQPGDRGRPPGGQGAVQSRGRRRAVHQPQGGGVPPGQHLRQVRPARHARSCGASSSSGSQPAAV